MGERCRVRATGVGVSETATMTAGSEAALAAAITASRQSGAGAIVLGSGAYAGRRQQLSDTFAMPFVDGLEAAIHYCEAASLTTNVDPTAVFGKRQGRS